MIGFGNWDIPEDISRRVGRIADFCATDNASEPVKYDTRARLYSHEDYRQIEQAGRQLGVLKERIRFFDGKGIIQATPFDISCWTFPHTDMFKHRENSFVPPLSLKVAYEGLPVGHAVWRETDHGEVMSGKIKVTREIIDDIAPYVHGLKRSWLYLALSENKKDREQAKNIIQIEIIDRLNDKREGWVQEGVDIVDEVLGLPYEEITLRHLNPEVVSPSLGKPIKRGLLERLFSSQ